jgi:NAD+ synthase (glutamine-hydrolysing)
VLFPELALTSYPRRTWSSASRSGRSASGPGTSWRALAEAGLGELAVIVGRGLRRWPAQRRAVLYRGEVAATYFKHHLPNYGVFDEALRVPGDRFGWPGSRRRRP